MTARMFCLDCGAGPEAVAELPGSTNAPHACLECGSPEIGELP